MHKSILKRSTMLLCIVIIMITAMLTSSCSDTRKLVVLNDLPDSPRVTLPALQAPIAVIQPDDILEIKISGKNPETVNDFNFKGGGYGANSLGTPPNYLVDANGDIEMFKIGKIKVIGFTKAELKDKLTKLLANELLDPSVTIRYANFRFTVLGEVKAPTTFTVPNEKVTILEAIGYAGDMTAFAKRNNVRVIRDSSGNREVGTVNFNQKTLFTSPYYYLHRNDVILVESDFNAKKSSENINRISAGVSILTGVVTLIFLIVRK